MGKGLDSKEEKGLKVQVGYVNALGVFLHDKWAFLGSEFEGVL